VIGRSGEVKKAFGIRLSAFGQQPFLIYRWNTRTRPGRTPNVESRKPVSDHPMTRSPDGSIPFSLDLRDNFL
jgi:hypothetical protein